MGNASLLKKILHGLVFALLFLPVGALADSFSDKMEEADALVAKRDPDSLLKAADIYKELCQINPASCEAHWKVAKASILYGEYEKYNMAENYEDIAKKYGKQGLDYGEKALEICPDSIDATFWFALSAGAYAEGSSIITALKEGLKGKFQKNFEKVYEIDKSYWGYYPVLALGEFWYSLPWPMADNDKALKYLKELNQLNPDLDEGKIFLARALIKDKNEKQARTLLEDLAHNSEIKKFKTEAQELLQKI